MRLCLIILVTGLIAISAISLAIRESIYVGILSMPVIAILTAFSIYGTFRATSLRKRRIATLLPGIVFLACLGLTNTPLKFAFSFFEPKFDELGERLMNGDQLAFPTWIGPFRIIEGGLKKGNGGTPYLMTGGDRYEINGFVRDPKGESFNLWSITALGDHWAYIMED